MADLTITKANVLPSTGARYGTGIAGGTVTAGQSIYKDSTDSNSLKPADANVSASAAVVGIASHDALDGQPLRYFTGGVVAFGSIITAGEIYVASAAAGGIAPIADLPQASVTVTADAGTDVLTATSHGLVDGDACQFTTTTTLPDPLATATTYYVRDATTHTLKVAATSGGAAIDITDAGTGTHTLKPVAFLGLLGYGYSATQIHLGILTATGITIV